MIEDDVVVAAAAVADESADQMRILFLLLLSFLATINQDNHFCYYHLSFVILTLFLLWYGYEAWVGG